MIKVGITGGIGSGKSTISEIFKLLRIPIFNADLEAKDLQNNDINIKALISNLLGSTSYTPDGILDRQKVAAIVFNDKKKLAAMNQIIHPAVKSKFLEWCEQYQNSPYILYEAAILLESGGSKDFDLIIVVIADEEERISRIIKRDQTTEEHVRQRIANQMPDLEKVKLADYLIVNNKENLLIPQILKIDQLIRENGKIR
jgi:dephospho-CoA kinase